MTNPYESAYFLILGQITLIISVILFCVPLILGQPTLVAQLDFTSIFYGIFIGFACFLTAFSILIGWASIKMAIKLLAEYTNRMFVINVLGIICLFMTNNIIMFSLSTTYAFSSFTVFSIPSNFSAKPFVVGVTCFFVYSLNGLYLFLCKAWNMEYYRFKKQPVDKPYELLLSFVIGIHVLCGFLSLFLFQFPTVLVLCFCVWVLTWLLINYNWIKNQLITSLQVPS